MTFRYECINKEKLLLIKVIFSSEYMSVIYFDVTLFSRTQLFLDDFRTTLLSHNEATKPPQIWCLKFCT